jgi:hypothetical protein
MRVQHVQQAPCNHAQMRHGASMGTGGMNRKLERYRPKKSVKAFRNCSRIKLSMLCATTGIDSCG